MSIRYISGAQRSQQLTPDTSVQDLLLMLDEDLPEFHVGKLFHGIVELHSGTLGKVGLSQGSELTYVASASPTLAVQIVSQVLTDCLSVTETTDRDRRRLIAALEFLVEQGEMEAAHCDILGEFLHDDLFGVLVPEDVAVAFSRAFGRICNAKELLPSLRTLLLREERFETATVIIALEEVASRVALDLPRNQLVEVLFDVIHAVGQWSYEAQPVLLGREAVLSASRFAVQLGDAHAIWSLKRQFELLRISKPFLQNDGWHANERQGVQ